jgi:hypothetical protein
MCPVPLDIIFNDFFDEVIGIDLMSEAANVIQENIEVPVATAAFVLYSEILNAFEVGGPGWRPLSQFTIDLKTKRKAPEPTAILKEWYKMRDSIEVRSETWSEIGQPMRVLPKRQSTFLKKSVDVGRLISHGISSVGLFVDTALEKNRVDRGYMHEFGGWEWQEDTIKGMGEVVTGGLDQKALKGKSELPYQEGGVRSKQGQMKKQGKWVYIPERSFLRMPFDKIEPDLFNIIIDEINKLLDLL